MKQRTRVGWIVSIVLAAAWIAFTVLDTRPKRIGRADSTPGYAGTVDMLELHASKGLHAFHRGHSTKSTTKFPRLPATNSFWARINSDLEHRAQEENAAFTDYFEWDGFWGGLKDSNTVLAWGRDARWEIHWMTPGFVSLIGQGWEYLGGSKPNTILSCWNAVPEGDRWRNVSLAEFFTPTSDWRYVVATHASAEINRVKRQKWGSEIPSNPSAVVTTQELAEVQFTFSTEGLRLWFAPYEKGDYVEGHFEPVIPYAMLIHSLDTNGPARWLPCFTSSR